MSDQTPESNGAIRVSPVSEPHAVGCPFCKQAVLTVFPEHAEAPMQIWLEDGDLIPGVHKALEERQEEVDGFDCELLVGRCRCGKPYYVISATFMDRADEEAREYLYFQKPFLGQRYFLCARAGAELQERRWLLRRCESEFGPLWHHMFGPFALENADTVVGPDGVWGCHDDGSVNPWHHGRTLLLMLWDELRSVRPHLDNVRKPHQR
jgi:hypothetical protein